MKKLLLSVLLFLVPFAVSASTCKVVSGDGTNIGDEISCSGENFYILSNDGETVKMLAKYNLYVGTEIYYIEVDEPYSTWSELRTYIYANYDGYITYYSDSTGYYAALVYNYLDYDSVLQSSLAIGAHGDSSGEPEYPEVGVVTFNYYDYDDDSALSTGIIYEDGYLDLNLDYEYNTILNYLNKYNQSLTNLGLEINDITILAVSDINEIVYDATGTYLPLSDWYNASWEYDSSIRAYKVGSIKDYLSDNYSWLWSTTYWTKTIAGNSYPDYDYMYFVDTLGDLCAGYTCPNSVGAGIRPVVTMSSNNIVYNITTKTDGNGTIEVSSETAYYSDLITFTITAKSGYTLSTLTLTASDGTSVTYELSGETYTFTVAQDTVIEATFSEIVEDVVEVDTTTTEETTTEQVEETNPNTGSFIPLVLIPLAVIGITFINKKQIISKI